MADHELAQFAPTLLSPGFLNPLANAVADDDADYLLRQLAKHHFVIHELPGAEMYDDHGLQLHLTRVLDIPKEIARQATRPIPDLANLLGDRAARRVALLIRNADQLIAADVQRTLNLLEAVNADAKELAAQSPPTQLLLFLSGPAPAFRPVEPSAKRRAEAQRGPKAMTTDFDAKPWSEPHEFDMRPHHTLMISHAAWYYASVGRRAEASDDKWHCVEVGDTLTFYRATDGTPCIAGTFARMKPGMQLVGVRYEADDNVFHFPWDGEDPFTFFRRLCEQLSLL
ncbi:MAG: hypothetical protein H6818_18845 [Phycisphaerales bacterium]|nr:hypothetical protein [Phycisphaerales bacterium]MCB9863806.1 hypothetical protein [Phycisphaerales bacterium]